MELLVSLVVCNLVLTIINAVIIFIILEVLL